MSRLTLPQNSAGFPVYRLYSNACLPAVDTPTLIHRILSLPKITNTYYSAVTYYFEKLPYIFPA